jgi:16S rRNA (uracil1498-N3)-methyltransferase
LSIFYDEALSGVLAGEEFRHCIKVMRHKVGDNVDIIDGKGSIYKCLIASINKENLVYKIQESEICGVRNYHIIATSPTKNIDRIEWMVEKSVEIGIGAFYFMECERTERTRLNTDRLNKVVISAMKQSKNIYKPAIHGLMSFNECVRQLRGYVNKYIAHCNKEEKELVGLAPFVNPSVLLIGPEGDFSTKEVEIAVNMGYQPVSLGKSRLRTETAGMVGTVMLNL